jgi:hypothetical protein
MPGERALLSDARLLTNIRLLNGKMEDRTHEAVVTQFRRG